MKQTGLFAEQRSVVCCHSLAEVSVAAELSLSLGGLDAELVAAVGVVELDESALGGRESLGGSLVSLYFCHFNLLLTIDELLALVDFRCTVSMPVSLVPLRLIP